MKFVILSALTLIGGATVAQAQYYGTGSNSQGHYVQPHTNQSGTYTSGHYQSNPNHTQTDNWSSSGNVNPYTGAVGTRNPRY